VRFIRRATHLSRPVAAALFYLVLLALVILAVVLLTPLVIAQIVALQRELVGFMRYLNTIDPGVTIQVLDFEFNAQILVTEVNNMLADLLRSLAAGSLTLLRNVAEAILLAVFTFLISFYVTRDAEKFIQAFEDLIPLSYRQDARLTLEEINKVWAAFFRGQVILSLVVTAILTALSAGLGLPHPLLIGVLGGLLEFLPSIGHTIWGATVVIIALLAGSTHLRVTNVTFALIVFAAYVIFAQFDVNILIPHIIGRHVRLHPMVVILGVIVGAIAGGVLGVALAAPTIASLRVIGRYIYAKLFGMNPFPMVGPPSVPWQERGAEAERRVASEAAPRSLFGVIMGRQEEEPRPNQHE
jgi:predicted PurR-regulated permease PerM